MLSNKCSTCGTVFEGNGWGQMGTPLHCCSKRCRDIALIAAEAAPKTDNACLTQGEGSKLDTNKKAYYAMPLEVLDGLAAVFEAGEKKYATFNCLMPFKDGDRRFWDAMMRHAKPCQIDPLSIDEETGCFHGYQVAFNIIMRTYHAEKRKLLEENNLER